MTTPSLSPELPETDPVVALQPSPPYRWWALTACMGVLCVAEFSLAVLYAEGMVPPWPTVAALAALTGAYWWVLGHWHRERDVVNSQQAAG